MNLNESNFSEIIDRMFQYIGNAEEHERIISDDTKFLTQTMISLAILKEMEKIVYCLVQLKK